CMSTARDTWVLGTGPFRRGSIVKGTEFAGEHLPLPTFRKEGDDDLQASAVPKLHRAASWREAPTLSVDPKQVPDLVVLLTGPLSMAAWTQTSGPILPPAPTASSDAAALTADPKTPPAAVAGSTKVATSAGHAPKAVNPTPAK